MSKQKNAAPASGVKPQPAASGSGNPKTIGTKPIRRISGPSLNTTPVGPKGAPFYAK